MLPIDIRSSFYHPNTRRRLICPIRSTEASNHKWYPMSLPLHGCCSIFDIRRRNLSIPWAPHLHLFLHQQHRNTATSQRGLWTFWLVDKVCRIECAIGCWIDATRSSPFFRFWGHWYGHMSAHSMFDSWCQDGCLVITRS